MATRRAAGTHIALIGVFAALIAASAMIPPLFMIGAVPFAIQLVFILLAPLALGPARGAGAVGLYLLAGFAGLPVFARGAATLAVLATPTGGYLVGYLLGAAVAGWLATRGKLVWLVAASVAGLLVVHACGVVGLMVNAGLGPIAALATTSAFLPVDLAKAALACALSLAVHKAFPRLRAPQPA